MEIAEAYTGVITEKPALPGWVAPAFDRTKRLESQIERLLSRLRIGVVFGGNKGAEGAVIHSTNNPRSWKSYEEVAQDIADALTRIGFRRVQLVPENMQLGDRLRREDIHFAWLNSGGVQGYNPMAHAPSVLEMLGVPYLGHDPLAVGTLDNKHIFKRNIAWLGYPTAPFMTWDMSRGRFRPRVNSRFIGTFKDHWGSYVVKPVSGRASLHVNVIATEDELAEAVGEVYAATQNQVLIEAYLPGREYCVAVMGPMTARNGQLSDNGEPFSFSEIERVFESGEKIVTSMDIKPITEKRLRLLDPGTEWAKISELRRLARGVYLDLNLGSLIRLDVRENESGVISILEANPKPDLKRPGKGITSVVSKGLAAHGMTYDDLILALLANSLDQLLNAGPSADPRLVGLLE